MNTKQSVAQLAVPHRKRLSSTMVVALLLCVVAGAVMINAADFPATAIETDPGASAFPTFYACALIVLAVLLVIRDLLQAKPASCANVSVEHLSRIREADEFRQVRQHDRRSVQAWPQCGVWRERSGQDHHQ